MKIRVLIIEELLNLRSLDNEGIRDQLNSLTCKYTSPNIQNELIGLLSDELIRKILPKDFF
jgi:hypothetical protein